MSLFHQKLDRKRNSSHWQNASMWVVSVLLIIGMGLLINACGSKAPEPAPPTAQPTTPTAPERPNIVLLVADDMGYADVGAFGSEIPTPNLDSLAQQGMMFSNFHTLPSCSPTRSVLLTGVDNHRNGLGTMGSRIADTQRGAPGYEGHLNKQVVTIATLLKDNGYHTYMAGKWHLGERDGYLPFDRGFEQTFSLGPGAASHFEDKIGFSPGRARADYYENGKQIEELPKGFYSTYFYTDKIIEFIEKDKADGKPFFAFFAYTAPHAPLHVPEDDTYVQEYLDNGTYDIGWDKLRAQRFERMKKLGLLPASLELPPRWPQVPDWNEMSEADKRKEAKRMAIYAAMIRHLDDQIGRFFDYLKEIGEYDNTIFIFFGDNGADDLDRTGIDIYQEWFKEEGIDNSYENIGKHHSFVTMVPGWAQVSGTPFYAAKASVAEGGLRNSFMVSYSGHIKPGSKTGAFASVHDLTPTFLDYAGVKHPGTPDPNTPEPMDGRSLRGLWEGKVARVYGDDDAIGFELYGTVNKALFMGDWKILRLGDEPWGKELEQPWKLFNLSQDPAEQNDLSAQEPERFKRMIARYAQYERDVGFVSSFPGGDELE